MTRDITRYGVASPVPFIASGFTHYFATKSAKQGVILDGSVPAGSTQDIAIDPTYIGLQVWATQLTSAFDHPRWVLADTTTLDWGIANVANGLGADGSHLGSLNAWLVTVPANTVAVRIGVSGAAQEVQLWQPSAGYPPTSGDSFSNEPNGYTNTQTRTQTYCVYACIGINPTISRPYTRFARTLPSGLQCAIGWQPNTPGVAFPVTFNGDTGVGMYTWFINQRPPDL